MGPSYACLFIGYVEQYLLRRYIGTIPHLFLLYIDDCISTTSCSHEVLEQFFNFTNTFHPNLMFTWTISDTSLSFLDLSVSMSGDHLETDIYFKPTDSHIMNHFKFSSYSLDDMPILGLLQCHNDATWKLEEQHL
eukprot:g20570.t1